MRKENTGQHHKALFSLISVRYVASRLNRVYPAKQHVAPLLVEAPACSTILGAALPRNMHSKVPFVGGIIVPASVSEDLLCLADISFSADLGRRISIIMYAPNPLDKI